MTYFYYCRTRASHETLNASDVPVGRLQRTYRDAGAQTLDVEPSSSPEDDAMVSLKFCRYPIITQVIFQEISSADAMVHVGDR